MRRRPASAWRHCGAARPRTRAVSWLCGWGTAGGRRGPPGGAARGGAPQFQFTPSPRARRVLPSAAGAAGGTLLSLYGSELGLGVEESQGLAADAAWVTFGAPLGDGQPVLARRVSTVLLMVEVPSGRPAAAPLSVSAGGALGADGAAIPGAASARYLPLPALFISAVQPSSGSVRGGLVVAVSGGGFGSGEALLGCRFGSVGPVSAQIVTRDTLRCVSPAHATGAPVPLGVSRESAAGDTEWGGGVTFEY